MDSHVRLLVSPFVNPAHTAHYLVAASPAHGFPLLVTVFVSLPGHTVCLLTGLVVLIDFFFNSVIVRVPCSLIFWGFWLFIDFRLVVILLLVVRGS